MAPNQDFVEAKVKIFLLEKCLSFRRQTGRVLSKLVQLKHHKQGFGDGALHRWAIFVIFHQKITLSALF